MKEFDFGAPTRALDKLISFEDEIKEKYIYKPILDDGNAEALMYAIFRLDYCREAGVGAGVTRWSDAIDFVTDSDVLPDWSRLKEAIEFDAKRYANDPENLASKHYARALFNLADSIFFD